MLRVNTLLPATPCLCLEMEKDRWLSSSRCCPSLSAVQSLLHFASNYSELGPAPCLRREAFWCLRLTFPLLFLHLCFLFSVVHCCMTNHPKLQCLKHQKRVIFLWFCGLTIQLFCFMGCWCWEGKEVWTKLLPCGCWLLAEISAQAVSQHPWFFPTSASPCGCLGLLTAWWLGSKTVSPEDTL